MNPQLIQCVRSWQYRNLAKDEPVKIIWQKRFSTSRKGDDMVMKKTYKNLRCCVTFAGRSTNVFRNLHLERMSTFKNLQNTQRLIGRIPCFSSALQLIWTFGILWVEGQPKLARRKAETLKTCAEPRATVFGISKHPQTIDVFDMVLKFGQNNVVSESFSRNKDEGEIFSSRWVWVDQTQ